MSDAIHIIDIGVEPKLASDRERLQAALELLSEELPSIGSRVDTESGVLILSGSSEKELDNAIVHFREAHQVELNVGAPQVVFKETLSRLIRLQYAHKKQTGGAGQFADVTIELEPLPFGSGFVFENGVQDGGCPDQLIQAVEQVIRVEKDKGLLTGFEVIDFRARLIDARYHDVDSTPRAFEIAVRATFRTLAEKRVVILLEPVMKLEVTTPEAFLGNVIGDLNSRQGHILGTKSHGNELAISAMVPMMRMFGYANTLQKIIQKHAQYTMCFDHYQRASLHTDSDPDPSYPAAAAMRVA